MEKYPLPPILEPLIVRVDCMCWNENGTAGNSSHITKSCFPTSFNLQQNVSINSCADILPCHGKRLTSLLSFCSSNKYVQSSRWKTAKNPTPVYLYLKTLFSCYNIFHLLSSHNMVLKKWWLSLSDACDELSLCLNFFQNRLLALAVQGICNILMKTCFHTNHYMFPTD